MKYYPEKVWNFGWVKSSTEKDAETGFKGGKFCSENFVPVDVFLFEHGSASDPDLIPVRQLRL